MQFVRDPRLKTLVIYSLIQRFSDTEALAYLKGNGYDLTDRTLRRIKKKIKSEEFTRLSDIAKGGFIKQHLERIDQLELIQKEIWSNYYKEKNPSKKVVILQALAQIQPYLSQYYEASKQVMEDEVQDRTKSNNISEI